MYICTAVLQSVLVKTLTLMYDHKRLHFIHTHMYNIQLMGRSSGFIAAHATLASGDVDLCLLPEMPIVLHGPRGCLPHLMRRVTKKGKHRPGKISANG
jgi:6-phosphofructokinase